MSIIRARRAKGYVKGYETSYPSPPTDNFDHLQDAITNRATIKTKSVDLKSLGLKFADLGIPIHQSDVVPMLKPVFIDHGALPYHFGVYLHPTDYYWVKYEDDPKRAHRRVEGWIAMRIDEMADEAMARIDNMHRDPQEVHERKVDQRYKDIFARYPGDMPMETQLALLMEWWEERNFPEDRPWDDSAAAQTAVDVGLPMADLETVGTPQIIFGENYVYDYETGKTFDGETMRYPWEIAGFESEDEFLSFKQRWQIAYKNAVEREGITVLP